MTRKPNFAKCMLGVFVLALLFIGTFGYTHAPRSTAANMGKMASAAAPSPKPSVTPPLVPPGVADVFEIDGDSFDQAVPVGSPDAEDWDDLNPQNSQSTNIVPAGSDAEAFSFVLDTGADDQIFTQGGSKDFNDVAPNWMHTTGSVPDKDEIDHAYAALYTDNVAGSTAFGHKILVFGGDRDATNGDANIGFWFFQNPVATVAGGTFTGVHKLGDVFVLSAFTGGGGTSTIQVYIWVGTNADGSVATLAQAQALCAAAPGGPGFLDPSGDTLCKLQGSSGAGSAIVNPKNLDGVGTDPPKVDWLYNFKGTRTPCLAAPCPVPAGAFYEGGVDLNALGLNQECFSSFMLETRSSQSVDAVLKDFALGSFQSCGIECSKLAAEESVCLGQSIHYSYTASNPNSPVAIEVTMIDDSGTALDTSDDWDVICGCLRSSELNAQTVTIQPGDTTTTYTRTVTPTTTGTIANRLTVHVVNQSGVPDCFADESVLVKPNPSCSIAGPDTACGGATGLSYTSTATTGSTHSWSITGNGTITSATDGATVTVTAGAFSAGTTFTLTDTVTLNGCSNTCSKTVTITDHPTATPGSEVCTTGVGLTLNQITLHAGPAGGSGGYTFSWTGPNGFASTDQNPLVTETATHGVTGTYTVTVTDSNGCTGSGSVRVGLCASP